MLKAEDRIAHYRVVSLLGAGGMGEVYRAKDESLERDVALKILPAELVKDEGRVRRFIQEAKSASSLSHPHIITIHEIGQAGVDSATVHFIAMELVTGDTLRQLIHAEKTALRTLLRYLAQAADGIAKAHAAGIVHRDLKPDNIMVTKDGFAKVLDFGLAKLTERQVADADRTSAPTMTGQRTSDGVVLGTAGYMSPEQVQGKPVDHRSDIFSFGCILYEAATRKRPFAAESDVETMHKILKDAPAPIEELNAEAPAELRRLIRRCLAKDPDARHHSMKDIAIDLREIVDEYETLGAATGRAGRAGRRAGIAAIAIVVLAAVTAGGWSVWHRKAESDLTASSPNIKMTRLASFQATIPTGGLNVLDLDAAVLSPDGRYLAFSQTNGGKYSLRVKQVATGSDIEILAAQVARAGRMAFSPDGSYVYFGTQDLQMGSGDTWALYQVPSLGGAPRKLIYNVDSEVTFSPDGKRIAFVRNAQGRSALFTANVDGTTELRVTEIERAQFHRPSWSPDGATIAAAISSFEGGNHFSLVEVALSDGKQSSIGAKRWGEITGLAWLPDRTGIALTAAESFRGSSQVWLVSYPGGNARKLTYDVSDYRGISVSTDSSTLATGQSRPGANLWVAPVGAWSQARQLTFGSARDDAAYSIAVTPSGSILFQNPKGDESHIWTIEPDGSRRKRLTPDGGRFFGTQASRRAGLVVCARFGADRISHIWRMDADGGNLAQVTNGAGEWPRDVSPDGRALMFQKLTEPGLWEVSLAGGSPVRVLDQNASAWYSPDGKYVLVSVVREEDGRPRRKLEVLPAEGGAPIQSLDWPQGSRVEWAPAGDAVTYIRVVDGVANIWSQSLTGGQPRQVSEFKSGGIVGYKWSTDGKQLVLTRGEIATDVVLITDFR